MTKSFVIDMFINDFTALIINQYFGGYRATVLSQLKLPAQNRFIKKVYLYIFYTN
ncbi:hypothetical protein [Acetobacterium woodii]|uniref:hypothetical protein n=1 Tax=Acetobacterium woodii TaxID=33952 RepID=UPI0002E9215A|nr:hypothetical protein [Acetobacterium woodii]